LVIAMAGCVLGAALVLLSTSRSWAHTVEVRPAPLPPVPHNRTGAAMLPWLPALGLVALAGAVALPATRRGFRTAVAVILTLIGAGIAAGATTRGWLGWPPVCAAGGAIVAAAGLLAVREGRNWPSMGSRYERRPSTGTDPWTAIDRGEDPTVG
jgi:hypothetical protein